MDRRKFLAASGAAFAAGLAGCSGILDSSPESETPVATATPEPSPSVSWSEEWISGSDYRVVANMQLDGVDEIYVRKNRSSKNTIATITSSGSHTIAGPDTDHGSLELGSILYAVFPNPEIDGVNKTVGSHNVGSVKQPSFPLFLRGLQGSTDPDLEQSGSVRRQYTQSVGNRKTELSISIPDVLTTYYSNRYRTRNYGAYVSDKYDDAYIDNLVKKIEQYGENSGLSDLETINHMMAFVQKLEYSRDKVGTGYNEYPKYPTETLIDRGGDCEDTVILLASMLEQFGYGSVLLAYPNQQHMALGVAGEEGIPGTYVEYNGQRYYYVETTASGWEIGQAPENMQGADAKVLQIREHPVLVFSYAVDTPAAGGAEVMGKMKNIGDGAAENAQLQVEFQDRNKDVLASATSDSKRVPEDSDASVTVSLVPPEDTEQRAKVSVLLDGDLHDFTTSEWRTPTEIDS